MTVGNVKISLLEFERTDVETPNDTNSAVVQEFSNNEKPLLPAVIKSDFDYTASTAHSVDWNQLDKDGKVIKPNYSSNIWDPTKINNEVDKMVFVKNTGDYSAYVRVFFAFEAGNYTTKTLFDDMIHINLNDNDSEWKWEWIPFLATDKDGHNYFIAVATYQKALAPESVTEISLSQIALDSFATNADVAAFDKTYNVLVHAQGIQSDGFGDVPEDALIEGFGRDIPFDMTLAQGVDLYTALHYYGGNKEDAKITDKVTSVTFGLNNEHKDVVSNTDNRAVFTSVEQDAEVYTYYVPNATDSNKYDVYVLADSAIYTPKDSTGLFQGMTSLTTVKTTNMDVSRTELMKNMFRDCSALTDLNVSNWNTQKVQTLSGAFWACSSLAELNVSDWSTGNVTSMYCLFYLCDDIKGLEVDGWNVSNVTNMAYMFQRCTSLTSLDVSSWDVGSVTTMSNMFTGCTAL
jgi:surface protein